MRQLTLVSVRVVYPREPSILNFNLSFCSGKGKLKYSEEISLIPTNSTWIIIPLSVLLRGWSLSILRGRRYGGAKRGTNATVKAVAMDYFAEATADAY